LPAKRFQVSDPYALSAISANFLESGEEKVDRGRAALALISWQSVFLYSLLSTLYFLLL
jgi:hypothetical protein